MADETKIEVKFGKIADTNIDNATETGKIYFVYGETDDNVDDNYLYVDGNKYGVSEADLVDAVTKATEILEGDLEDQKVTGISIAKDEDEDSIILTVTLGDESTVSTDTVTLAELGIATSSYVGELPVGTEATTVTGYIEEVEATLKEELGDLAGALVYKGTVASVDELPEDAETGDLYIASAEFEYGGHTVDIGDLLIALDKEGTLEWDIISRDLDDVVTASDTFTEGNIIVATGEMEVTSKSATELGIENKIDSISVNGVEQEINENKNVDITVSEVTEVSVAPSEEEDKDIIVSVTSKAGDEGEEKTVSGEASFTDLDIAKESEIGIEFTEEVPTVKDYVDEAVENVHIYWEDEEEG